MKKVYLCLYNLAASAGWAYVFALVAQAYLDGLSATALWTKLELPLKIVQTANALEMVHSLLGLVPSPFITTAMQVMSRLVLLWAYTAQFTACQAHWSLYLMAGSWAFVEVPRYLFYAVNLFTSQVPYPLFFLRYSLFMVLYPSGISGELLQVWNSLPTAKVANPAFWYFSLVLLLVYVPAGPFMYSHMLIQRKRSNQKRKETAAGAPAKVEAGILFPMTSRGERSTTALGKNAFAAALQVVDKAAAEKVLKERDWRFGYTKHVVKAVDASCKSPADCIKVAQAGLDYLHNNFEFVRDGKSTSLAKAMSTITSSFHTGFIKGTGKKPANFELEVPYKGKNLSGAALEAQLDKWVAAGTIEPDCGEAIKWVSRRGERDVRRLSKVSYSNKKSLDLER